MVTPPASGEGRARRRFLVQGVVQGVGFRPFVYATASELMLSGSVTNSSAGVVVEVEGAPFGRRGVPAAAASRRHRRWPWSRRVTAVDVAPRGGTGFSIGASTTDRAGRTLASPDVATCADCLRELADPGDRRYRHPFITCTNCGPRFTIIDVAPLRPARPPRWPASRCATAAPASTPTRPTDASTPSRSPAPTAGRRSSWSTRPVAGRTREDALAGARGAARRRWRPRGQGPRRLPPGLRRHQRGRRRDAAGAASSVATSRSR